MPNPFFFAGKITNPEHFVGREKELKKIFGYLDATHTGQIQHVSVVGERRIGKSSLLYHLSQTYSTQLPDNKNYRFIYLDLDNPHCHTLFGLLHHILEKLDLPAPAEPTLERFYDLIEQEHEKKKIWPVFLMDEFEHLPEHATEFPDRFYDSLRSLGNNNIVGLVTASQNKLQDLASQGKLTSPFFNIFHQIDLKEFTDAETNTLLVRGSSIDRPFTNYERKQIIKLAGNHPARLQLVASAVFESIENNKPVNWSDIKQEIQKQPPYTTAVSPFATVVNWALKIIKWPFISLPQMVGRAFFDILKYEKSAPETNWIVGAILLAAVIGLLAGVIPWTLVAKFIRRFTDLFIK